MHADTQKVASRALAWQRAGIPCWWATVIHTYGSSPVPVACTLAVNEAEEAVGSVGVPRMSHALVQRISKSQPSEPCEWVFGADDAQARALGFPVGADPLVVWVEPVAPDQDRGLESLVRLLGERRSAARNLITGQVSPAAPNADVLDDAGGTVVHHPPWRLIMTGATPVSAALCNLALSLNFECVLIEPRMPFLSAWSSGQGSSGQVRSGLAEVRVESVTAEVFADTTSLDPKTAVLALAHDPEIDDPLLLCALEAPVFLLGALGSRANHAARLERLAARGANAEALDRIQGPLGLDIGSRTPAEISIAILAQLISVRRASAA